MTEVRPQWPGWLVQSSPCPAAVWKPSRLSCHGYGRRAVEVLLPRRSGVRRPSLDGVGRAGNCVRGPEGSDESELASEALRGQASRNETELASEALRCRASRNLRPRPWGVGRVGTCVRGPEGSGELELASEALMIVVSMFLCVFSLLWFGYPLLWYPTHHLTGKPSLVDRRYRLLAH